MLYILGIVLPHNSASATAVPWAEGSAGLQSLDFCISVFYFLSHTRAACFRSGSPSKHSKFLVTYSVFQSLNPLYRALRTLTRLVIVAALGVSGPAYGAVSDPGQAPLSVVADLGSQVPGVSSRGWW